MESLWNAYMAWQEHTVKKSEKSPILLFETRQIEGIIFLENIGWEVCIINIFI